jgi:acyl-CoA synthetase (AMP-forming)/AMP-acid ligase II
MPQATLNRLAQAFPEARLRQKFGTSETGAIRIQSADNGSLFFRIEDPDTEWKVVDEELWLKTPSRILGYLNAASDNLEAGGWYRTGDLVETDGEGKLRIVGRASALINVGGRKVHPAEIETLLNQIPGILGCRVYGVSDPITGSQIACEIFPGQDTDLRQWKRTIRRHCVGKIETWKIPSKIALKKTLQTNTRLKGV